MHGRGRESGLIKGSLDCSRLSAPAVALTRAWTGQSTKDVDRRWTLVPLIDA